MTTTASATAAAAPAKPAPEYLHISLTDRAPVRIRKDKWALIASAKDWDNQYECQANRTWSIRVRQHHDGRTIVYGIFDSQFQSERSRRGGELLVPAGDGPLTAHDGRVVEDTEIAAAIHRIAEQIGAEQIAQECIQDLPAETLNHDSDAIIAGDDQALIAELERRGYRVVPPAIVI